MSQISRIFLVADAEAPHSPAFERARALALATKARVHIGAFVYSRAIAAVGVVDKEGMEQARDGYVATASRAVEQQAVYLRDLGLEASHEACWAHPVLPELLIELAELKSDLVIKDAHRAALPTRLVSASLDQLLIRHSRIPVMLVGPDDRPLPKRVLLAVDVLEGDPALNDQLLRQALAVALQCGGQVHVAYVSEPVIAADGEIMSGAAMNQALIMEITKARRQAFDAFVESNHLPIELTHYLEGSAAATLCEFAASNGFDVIVIATANHGRLERWLLGSTAEHVIARAPCSVLAVPTGTGG